MANTVCKHIHQTMRNVFRTLLRGRNFPQNLTEANESIDEALSITQRDLRSTVHTTICSSPGSLVFSQDMFQNIPLLAGWNVEPEARLVHSMP